MAPSMVLPDQLKQASQSAMSGPGGPPAAAITGPGTDYGGTGCRMTGL